MKIEITEVENRPVPDTQTVTQSGKGMESVNRNLKCMEGEKRGGESIPGREQRGGKGEWRMEWARPTYIKLCFRRREEG